MIINPFDDRADRPGAKIIFTFALLIAFNIAAWIWAWVAFADRPSLLGIALLAYMFGLRHAFDADHIAAIDNVGVDAAAADVAVVGVYGDSGG